MRGGEEKRRGRERDAKKIELLFFFLFCLQKNEKC